MTHITHNLPDSYAQKWQVSINLVGKFFNVQAALITQVVDDNIQVLVSSNNENNPYELYAKQKINCSLYCEAIVSDGVALCIENAVVDPKWKGHLEHNLGMISYFGHPLFWPNGDLFGTICILDKEERSFTEEDKVTLRQLRSIVEADLNISFQSKVSEQNLLLLKESLEQKTKALMDEVKERKLKVKELREYEVIVANSTDMLALIDTNYIYIHVNHRYLEKFEIPREDIIGKTIIDLMGTEVFEEVIKPKFLACFAGETISFQDWFTYPSLGKRYMDVTYAPYYGVDHEVDGVVVRVHDITENKLLSGQLLQAQKMESIGLLAGGVAHDLNNALTVIMGGVELSKHYTNENDPINTFLDQIMSASKHSSEVIRQLLTFARKQSVSPKVLEMNNAIEGMITVLKGLIGDKIEFIWEPSSGIWPVAIDPVQLEQILMNLCTNARDAITNENGKISIELSNVSVSASLLSEFSENIIVGDYVVLKVIDNGHGIAKERVNKIFDPFYTSKDIGKGTGLGLATVYGITKQNMGYIDLISQVNKGTSFLVYLPRNINLVKEKLDTNTNDSPKGNASEIILLVEDDKLILDQTQRSLKNLGYYVLTASNPDSAISLFKQHANKISLLVTDVIMPKMNGRDLYVQLQKQYPELKVLFMSGYASTIIHHQELLENNVNFLQKPFSSNKLALSVRNAIDL